MKRLQIVRTAGRADKMISKRCAVRRTRENWWVRCDKIVMFNGFRCHCDDGHFPSFKSKRLTVPPRFINEFLICARLERLGGHKIDGNLSNMEARTESCFDARSAFLGFARASLEMPEIVTNRTARSEKRFSVNGWVGERPQITDPDYVPSRTQCCLHNCTTRSIKLRSSWNVFEPKLDCLLQAQQATAVKWQLSPAIFEHFSV